MATIQNEPGPMAGIIVVDFTSMVSGPWATRLMADCGATVIKVEQPGGDYMRALEPKPGLVGRPFTHFNAGKRSVTLDLATPAGRAIAVSLVRHADVAVENFRRGYMARRRLDFETVKADCPRLVYCSLSGYGLDGPLVDRPAYAPIVEADSGLNYVEMAGQPGEGGGDPRWSPLMVADVVAGLSAFAAVQTALLHRERTGEGGLVDVSLMESVMSIVGVHYQQAQADPPVIPMVHRPIRTEDGWLMVALVSAATFHGMYRAIGRAGLINDPEYGSMGGTRRNRDVIFAMIEEWAGKRGTAVVEAALEREGVPCARYRSPREVVDDQHLSALGAFADAEDDAGSFKLLNPPFRLLASPVRVRSIAETEGASTRAVLTDLLGMDADAIARCAEEGAFGQARSPALP